MTVRFSRSKAGSQVANARVKFAPDGVLESGSRRLFLVDSDILDTPSNEPCSASKERGGTFTPLCPCIYQWALPDQRSKGQLFRVYC